MKKCNREGCDHPQHNTSPLFLCHRHQRAVDAHKLGWAHEKRKEGNRFYIDMSYWEDN